MVRFLSEWSGRKTGSQPIAKEKEVRKKLTVARTGQRLWEITYGATSPRPSLPPRPLFLRVEARNCRTRAALAVFTLECEEWLLLAKRAPFNAGWIWEVSTNMCSITTVVLQMRNFVLSTSRLAWAVAGTWNRKRDCPISLWKGRMRGKQEGN